MIKNRLNAAGVAALTKARTAGKYRDGAGLQLEITGASFRWMFSYSWNGRQCSLGIGHYPNVSLAAARSTRDDLRLAKAAGLDPRAHFNKTSIPAAPVRFRQSVDDFFAHTRERWSAGHQREWLRSVNSNAAALMAKPTASLTEADIVAALRPIWGTKHLTAQRVLARISDVIDHARTHERNPCADVAKRCLPYVKTMVTPRAAMPWSDLPAFFQSLADRDETAAHAIRLMLLACCPRTGEVLNATWSEIVGDRWFVPAHHMKSGATRTIPLVPAAADLLAGIRPIGAQPSDLIFAADRKCASGGVARDAMQNFLRIDLALPWMTHGFRSSFADWVAENHPSHMMTAEKCLDHTIGNRVSRAYFRTDLLDARRQLADLWAAHLLTNPKNASITKNVIAI